MNCTSASNVPARQVDSEARSGRPSTPRNEIVVDQVVVHWWCRIVRLQSENLQTRRALAIDLFVRFDSGFGLQENFNEVHAKDAKDKTESIASGDCTGYNL